MPEIVGGAPRVVPAKEPIGDGPGIGTPTFKSVNRPTVGRNLVEE